MNRNYLIRAASVAAMMLAGSCTGPFSNPPGVSVDPEVNHPITVEPAYQSLKLSFSARSPGLMPDDEARFMDFVENYQAHGNGAISVSVPNEPGAERTIRYFGARLSDMGVLPSRILVGTRDAGPNDGRVEIGFVGYVAHADDCGDWSDNVADTASNLTTRNYGCSVQHNIAAMVADPRDLQTPSAMGSSDAVRRNDVMGKYETGHITQADKNKLDKINEQSGAGSDVGSNK
ncbi:MAG TPA: CpaD family pilus assembly protein [Rhizomicrobium sp.]|nr:CpaD family pilus assembly protein [Rhizomicrobium sp.]